MDINLNYLDFIDVMNEGLIYVDTEGKIQLYNEKAKEILGVKRLCKYSHPKDRIKEGDIVILAITGFGLDDGGLTLKDLNKLGVNPQDLEQDSSVLAIGRYGDHYNKGIFNIKGPSEALEELTLDKYYEGLSIQAKIDYFTKNVSIKVDGVEYCVDYNNNFGHGVIIEENTKLMKFYQQVGYTAWKEDIKSILKGCSFNEKLKGINEIDMNNVHISENHEATEIISRLLAAARGEGASFKEEHGTINGVSVIYTVQGILKNDKPYGALLLISDITRLKSVENQRNLVSKKLESVEAKLDEKKLYSKLFPQIIGSSEGVMEVKKLAFKASKSQSNVLILGESGTGKSILARSIHEADENSKKPFIHVNCNSIPENLLESELFGYDKGAFTGANVSGKKGFFEMADGGTIFLDEIGDISNNMQVKLLHVIQNKKFFRVGGNKEIHVDVRIITATNKELEAEVKKGSFRADLYYRINVFPIHILPLRERKEDIFELVEQLMPRICERIGLPLKRISGEALNKLMHYSWPGNIRELENVLERAVNISEGNNILSEDIMINAEAVDINTKRHYLRPLKYILEEVEIDTIKQVMKYTHGDKKRAMEILDMKKTSFYDKLKNI